MDTGCSSKCIRTRDPADVPVEPMKPMTWPARTCAPFDGELRERREVRVEELVPLRVAKPELVPGGAVPADPVERPRRDRDDRLPQPAVDVGAAHPAAARSRAPVSIRDGRPAEDRVHVRCRRQLGRRYLRQPHERARRGREELRAVADDRPRCRGPRAGLSAPPPTRSRAGSPCPREARRARLSASRPPRPSRRCSPSSLPPSPGRRGGARSRASPNLPASPARRHERGRAPAGARPRLP